jgi:hypothetical protein
LSTAQPSGRWAKVDVTCRREFVDLTDSITWEQREHGELVRRALPAGRYVCLAPSDVPTVGAPAMKAGLVGYALVERFTPPAA